MKVKMLQNVIASIEGKSKPLGIDQEIEVNDEDGENLVNGGYAVQVDKPKPAARPKKQEK